MPDEIQILFLEDTPAEAVRVNHELRLAGMAFRLKRVETRDAFLQELVSNPPDVILSDNGLPAFDGFSALTIAHEKHPETPFLFVTSSLGEQKIVEMFRRGATDYVMKDNLSKLAPAVSRALQEAEARRKLKQKELNLHESETHYRHLVEGSPNAIFVVQRNDRIGYLNPAAVKLLGRVNGDELLGKRAQEIFHHGPWDTVHSRLRSQQRRQKAPAFIRQRLTRADGTGCEAEISAAPTVFKGEPAVQVIAHDVGERGQAAEKLRQSEALKTAILKTAFDAIISVDHEGKIQEWNSAAERIFGYTRARAVGQSMDGLIIPRALWEIYHDGLTNYLITGAGSLIGRPIELTLRQADASEFSAELAVTRVPTENPPRCTVLVRDITERKKAEASLRESEERLRLLISSVKDYAIYMLNTEGNVASWNEGAQRIKGYAAAEIIGKPFSTFFTPEDKEAGIPGRVLKQAEDEGRAVYEGWRVRKDGSRFWVMGIITAMRYANGKLYGFSKVARDITAQREAAEKITLLNEQLEQRVRERTAQLEAANGELEAFSYSVSHDLRAPLRHIAGYVEILQRESSARLDPTARQHLDTIAKAAQDMNALIEALLAFSQMGRVVPRRQRVNLGNLVDEAIRELRGDFEGRKIQWRIGVLPEIEADPLLLRRVIINLLSNAAKYTRGRKQAVIEIGATESKDEVTFLVRDNGVGFDMAYVGKLFGVFQRLHAISQFEGVGIGLANVRRIIHGHGGRVWAEGAVDKGATFFFTIPKETKGTI